MYQSNFGDSQSLIDFPSSESLASLLVTFLSFLECRLGITVRVDSSDIPSFELLPVMNMSNGISTLQFSE